jgi:hypothetical protein
MADKDVTCSGPVFDGRAQVALRGGIEAVRHKLASEGEKLVTAAFSGMIRFDTGRFLHTVTTIDESRTFTTQSGHKVYAMPVVVSDTSTDTIVTTSLASYGPWLEGTGSRNETTRFKGYHGFRMAGQELNLTAESRANEALLPYVREMNA